MILEQITFIQQELDTLRFRGEDPIISIPKEDRREAIIAKVLAAQSRHAVLGLDSERFNPDEESARKRLEAGQGKLDYWNFRDARRLFDEAAKRARQPALQQRITLFRLFTDFLKEVVMADADRTLASRVRQTVLEPLKRLDLLPPVETAHYEAEIERLWQMRADLKTDVFLQTVWMTVQARIAMDFSESAQGMTWLLAAAHLNRDRLEPNAYLQGMLDRAKLRILRLIGEERSEADMTAVSLVEDSLEPARPEDQSQAITSPEERTKEPEDDRVRPRDLYDTLLVALEEVYGVDVRSAGSQFRVKRFFVAPDGEDAESVA